MSALSTVKVAWDTATPDKRHDLLAILLENITRITMEPEKLEGWTNNLPITYSITDFDKLPKWLQEALAIIEEFDK